MVLVDLFVFGELCDELVHQLDLLGTHLVHCLHHLCEVVVKRSVLAQQNCQGYQLGTLACQLLVIQVLRVLMEVLGTAGRKLHDLGHDRFLRRLRQHTVGRRQVNGCLRPVLMGSL